MLLPSTNPFSLRDLAFSHGWIALPPWSWQADPPALARIERLPSGTVVRLTISSATPEMPTEVFQVCLPIELSSQDEAALKRRLRWMLRLDEDLSAFHGLLRTLPGCETPAARGEGRLLRSWDMFEDAVKTICTTNTTWSQTGSMVSRLLERFGERREAGTAFPEPERLAAAPESELRACGMGYRAAAVRALAEAIAVGDMPREAADWAVLPSEELHARLLALRGIGPYAAANLRMLLGHYDRLAIDSWLRRTVREAWYVGAPVSDREIEDRFNEFGPWRALVYWFHPALHPARDAWREAQVQKKGPCCPKQGPVL